MSAYKFASLSLVTLLALSGCGSGEEVTPNTTPPASPMAVEAEETTFDLEAILEEEPVIFNEWRTAEPGSTGEAEAEAELDAIYESLEEEYGELDVVGHEVLATGASMR